MRYEVNIERCVTSSEVKASISSAVLSSQPCGSSALSQWPFRRLLIWLFRRPTDIGFCLAAPTCSANGNKTRCCNLTVTEQDRPTWTISGWLPRRICYPRNTSNHPVVAGHRMYSVQIEARICKSLHVVKCRQVPCRNHGSTSDPLLSSPGPTTNATLFLLSGEWHCMKRARAS